MSETAPIVYRVPPDYRAAFRTAMHETAAADPDAATAAALFVEIWRACTKVTRTDQVSLDVALKAETAQIAVLAVGRVPVVSLVACQNIFAVRNTDTVADIRFVFRHQRTHQPLNAGLVEIQFWRHGVAANLRQPTPYKPPAALVELAATPLWDAPELRLEGAQYATDRKRIVDIIRLVGSMHDEMPTGVQTALDLVYPTDFYTPGGVGKRKRGVAAAAPDADGDGETQRKHRGANKSGEAFRGAGHVGYCLIFQHPDGALPTFNAAFMAHVEKQIGPTLLNWYVLFAHTRPVAGVPAQVRRCSEALAIVLRRSECEDADVMPHTISGVNWIVRRIEQTTEPHE